MKGSNQNFNSPLSRIYKISISTTNYAISLKCISNHKEIN